MSEYLTNLKAFKNLIESYTIADLKSMVYEVGDSGGCCYPAIQTLFSLMELIGKLISPDTCEKAFASTFTMLGKDYNVDMAAKLYKYFRQGIAHNSLAWGGVQIKKSEDRAFHLSGNGNNINIRVLLEDFIPLFHEIFDKRLQQKRYLPEYESRLRDVFGELKIEWISDVQQWGGLDISADYTRTDVTTSGTRLPVTKKSRPSATELDTDRNK